jgi:hypothetical protein
MSGSADDGSVMAGRDSVEWAVAVDPVDQSGRIDVELEKA